MALGGFRQVHAFARHVSLSRHRITRATSRIPVVALARTPHYPFRSWLFGVTILFLKTYEQFRYYVEKESGGWSCYFPNFGMALQMMGPFTGNLLPVMDLHQPACLICLASTECFVQLMHVTYVLPVTQVHHFFFVYHTQSQLHQKQGAQFLLPTWCDCLLLWNSDETLW